MRVVLTRPEQEAVRWLQPLQARGHEVMPLPLIAIRPLADLGLLHQAWKRLPSCAAAMFVSANAVHHFRAAAPDAPWPAGPRAWATGPGTLQALLQAGVPPDRIDAPAPDAPQFDSEALWRGVQGQVPPGGTVLVVRGADAQGRLAGRDWLAREMEARGLVVEQVAAYRRELPAWGRAQFAQAAAAARDGSVWLFSSSEAVANLRQLLPGQDWSAARALATHERIAQAAREAGFGVVWPSRPSVEGVTGILESIR